MHDPYIRGLKHSLHARSEFCTSPTDGIDCVKPVTDKKCGQILLFVIQMSCCLTMTFDYILLHTHTHITQHSDDDIEVRSVRLADSGSFVDQDDEVVDVLEDKETVGMHLTCYSSHFTYTG